jgi:predicted permease
MTTDLKSAIRALRRTPGFTVTVVLTLGLGIGASTVALGLVDAFLLRSLPYPGGDRLVAVWPEENWSQQMVETAREEFPSLSGLAALGGTGLVLQEGGEPEEVFASQATTNYFDVLGVRPALGRGFVVEDGVPGAEAVTILANRIWVERFGSDPDILGRSIELGGDGTLRRTVVGVMGPDHMPLQGTGVTAWVPVVLDPTSEDWDESYYMQAVGRLAPGVDVEQTRRELDGFVRHMQRLKGAWFTADRTRVASALSLAQERSADRRTPLLLALGAALLVLLVACANVANLVVARTAGRERELSVRAALGAGRARTARAVLMELVVLAAAGTVAGIGLAAALVQFLDRRFPRALPTGGLDLDVRWAVAAATLAVLAAAFAGLIPGMQAARRDPARAMSGGRGAQGSRAMSRLQEILSATQLALAMAGIAAMALLGRSLVRLDQVDPGFTTDRAITFSVTAPPAAYPEDADVVRFFREARRSMEAVPGVSEVGFGSRLPLAGGESRMSVVPEGWDFQEDDAEPEVWHRLATPGYLEALGVRLVEGRIPTAEGDRDDVPMLAVINRAAARKFWPGESAVGKRFYGPGHVVWLTVAGVVDDVMENGQDRPVLPGVYIPHRDWPWRTMYAVVRAREDPALLLPALKSAMWGVSAGVPISRVATLEAVRDRGLSGTRALTLLAGLAGAVTLLLGALGVYGVVSHSVTRRLREIGVRAALGADRRQLLMGELSRASRIVAWGLPAGLLAAWVAGRSLQGVLFGVSALDPLALSSSALALAAVAYLSALWPARRAARVDPVQVIREE